jgi:putative multiple sugar transport system permease protein
METLKNLLRNNMRQYTMLVALVVLMLFFQIVTNGVLLVPMNITNLVLQNAYVFILAIGMMVLLIKGGNIDLSVGSITAFTGAISGILIVSYHWPVLPVVMIDLVVGVLIGCWQGFWVAYVRIPGFIVTLAGMLIFRGLTLNFLKGLTISPFPNDFQQIANGFVPDLFGSQGLNITALLTGVLLVVAYMLFQIRNRAARRKYHFDLIPLYLFIMQLVLVTAAIMLISYWLASYKGIPVIFLIIAILVMGYSFFTSMTVPGRYLYASGGNEKAAALSGINVNRVMFFVYVNMAVLATFAGIVATARLNAASPVNGTNFEMDAISACFVGGASMYGGVGTVTGAIIGALFMGVLNNGMSIIGLGTDVQMVVKGLVLLLAVAFDIVSKARAKAA